MTGGPWLPSPVVLQMLALQRMVAPDAYADALEVATALPLHEHPEACVCPACIEARLVLGALPPDPFTDTDQETPVPKKTLTVAQTSPCRTCGVAVPWTRKYPTTWTTCSPEHYRPNVEACRAEVLARLGLTDRPDDPAVVMALPDRTFFADRDDAHAHTFGEHENPLGSLLPSRPQGTGSREPWAHLDARDLRKRIKDARRDLAKPPTPPRLAPCKTAALCAGCGVSKATAWVDFGTRKAPMVLCEACGEALDRSGGDSEGWRARLLAQALRLDLGGRAPSITFRSYEFKTAADLGARPADTRFAYVPADDLARLRSRVVYDRPQLGTPEERARVERIKAARAAVNASRPTPSTPALLLPGGSR